MRFHTQALFSYELQLEGTAEKKIFKQIVQVVPRDSVPKKFNYIFSHVVYKFKQLTKKKLKMMVLVAPHGNEDHECETHEIDFLPGSLVAICVVASV